MKQETIDVDKSNKIIRTLCVLFFAILLRDYSISTIEWYWAIPVALVIICFMIVNAITGSKKRARRGWSGSMNV